MNKWESGFFKWLVEWLHPHHCPPHPCPPYPCIHVAWGPVSNKVPPTGSEDKHV